jgi:hypothetical protein
MVTVVVENAVARNDDILEVDVCRFKKNIVRGRWQKIFENTTSLLLLVCLSPGTAHANGLGSNETTSENRVDKPMGLCNRAYGR